MIKEKVVEDHLKMRCKEYGIYQLKNQGTVGIPDRLLLYKGRYIFVEVKRPGGKPRESQIARIAELERNGAEVRVIDRRRKVDELVQEITGEECHGIYSEDSTNNTEIRTRIQHRSR